MAKKIHIETPSSYSSIAILESLLQSQIAHLQKIMVQNSQFDIKQQSMLKDCISMLRELAEMRGEIKKKSILKDLSEAEKEALVQQAIDALSKP